MTDLLKLYYAPGVCSLAAHTLLAYIEEKTGTKYEIEKVDLHTHKTEKGTDFYTINDRGAVPVLSIPQTSKPAILTQNGAVLTYLGDKSGIEHLTPKPGTMERARLEEALAFCSDFHSAIGPLFFPSSCSEERNNRIAQVHTRLKQLEKWLPGDKRFWLSSDFCQADLYMAVLLSWCSGLKIDLSAYPKARKIMKGVFLLPAAQKAIKAEGFPVENYLKLGE